MSIALRLLRKLLRLPGPRVTANEASCIGREEAAKRAAKVGRTVVREGLRRWIVWIDADVKGSPVVEIDNRTGEVLRWAVLPR